AYTRKMMNLLESYVDDTEYSNNILERLVGVNNLDTMTDLVVPSLPIMYPRQLSYIQETDAKKRSLMIMEDIRDDICILEIEKKIDEKLSHDIDQSQKEYVLREKIRVIKEELGDINDKDSDIEQLREKTKKLNCSDKIRNRLLLEINRYETSNPNSPEIGIIRNYIDWLLDLPWKVYTTDNKDLRKVKDVLDNSHYGLDIVKERIIEYLAVKQNTKSLKSPIICLVGPPGVGKTSLAKSIADALNRKWTKISVGGINDEAEIVGHRRTYVGSAPGLIIQGM
ncbi:MAG: AAA family ATPase, partial [Bacilli bacterium]|nr:AAA family ATPase [Bacilli bacterium]